MIMKINMNISMLKLVLASAILLVIGTIVVSAATPMEPVLMGFEPFQYHLTPPVTGGAVNQAWRTLNGSQVRVSSNHNQLSHRGRVTVGDYVLNSPWSNRNVQSNSRWIDRSGSVGIARIETR